MNTVIEKLKFDTRYVTGPKASTDLHAGGVFFCVVYRECIQFDREGGARHWFEVIDDSRALDDEAEDLRGTDMSGRYSVNDRGYLVCKFEGLELVGLPCEKASELLAFHAWRPEAGIAFSLVFEAN